ncbi:MAG: alpha/beta fold hydrolase [Chloroflexi bacterium]|nr:alpha/beta fold hydrolase [Chloroflexota bacterium]
MNQIPAPRPVLSATPPPGAVAFEYAGDGTGVLLIHGFGGTPLEVRGLGEYLHQQGRTVLGVHLPGHATTPAEMEHLRWQDWLAIAEEGYSRLWHRCDRVFVGGLSMGGALSLLIASRVPVAGIFPMAAPTHIEGDWRLNIISLAKYFVRWHDSSQSEFDLQDPTVLERLWWYQRLPVAAIEQLMALLSVTYRRLPLVRAPALVMQGYKDITIPHLSSEVILRRLASLDKHLVWLHNSGHAITEDLDRKLVWALVDQFIEDHSKS